MGYGAPSVSAAPWRSHDRLPLAAGADLLASANLSPSLLYGTTGDLAAACDVDPSCIAFTSNGFAGRLKSAFLLTSNSHMLETGDAAVASQCVYFKHIGRRTVLQARQNWRIPAAPPALDLSPLTWASCCAAPACPYLYFTALLPYIQRLARPLGPTRDCVAVPYGVSLLQGATTRARSLLVS